MAENIKLEQITPIKPKVLDRERVYVYVPIATTNSAGIAQFNAEDFAVVSGKVSLNWSMKDVVELADPLARPSLTKVIDDEFVHTGNTVTITHNGKTYSSNTSEIKFNRANRDAFARPDFVMLDNSNNDFVVTTENDYNKYRLARNNPLVQPSLVKADNRDFDYTNETVIVKWPVASNPQSLTGRTNGYGLMKIADASAGYLKYDDNGNTELDYNALYEQLNGELETKPTYGADKTTGFTDYDSYVDNNGIARKDSKGRTLLKLTKDAVGLSKVANKAFNEYVYDDFGQSMQNTFTTKFNNKLDKTTWNNLFSDWAPKSTEINTPHKWLVSSDDQIDSIWNTISSMGIYLGVFNTPQELEQEFPAGEKTKNSNAFVLSTNTYWAVKIENGYYTWYDTKKEDISFYEAMETNPASYKANALVPSAGSTGKWAQSDHVHPTDDTRLSKVLYQTTNLTITSNLPNSHDFRADFWEKDAEGNPVANPDTSLVINVPYIRTAKYLHNWATSLNEFVAPNNELYWAGSQDEFNQVNIDDIPDNSLIIVDDGENAEPGTFLNKNEVSNQGITIDPFSTERFVIIKTTDNFDGLPVTIKTDSANNRRKIDKITLLHPDVAGNDPLVVVVPKLNGNTIKERFFTTGRLLEFNEAGTPIETEFDSTNIVTTERSGTTKSLDINRIILSNTGNTIKTFDTGAVENKLLVSDGANGVKMLSNLEPIRLLQSTGNGTIAASNVQPINILRTVNDNNIKTLDTNKLLISRANNIVDTYDTGTVKNRLLVANGDGGVTGQELPNNQLIISDNNGNLTNLATGPNNAGQYYGVSAQGTPTLITPPITPTSLPVTTLTSNPTTSQVSTVLVFANPNGNYMPGCLYLY